ncbi:argininosuccinate synthase [Methanomicrobium antiquum]|uniref:Argininosuccinate synthase n=1 Tax=Methanomicrobium antiquum TaxID=487686 RepID=A0AAF0FT28_9EURY|nr:argininosuccinate synthase [Methanomicrobium antiquum]MDD3977152.1 argininosuccinate synthase [Methanomicrobium sp.]WFN37606.1 argininosuccinate synthase [Methanomicrobium antiquum]
MGKGKVVLAFSGGLDTSVCVPLLKEHYGFDEVITVAVDVGQPKEDIDKATEKGKKIADKHYTIDIKDRFVEEQLFPSIKANGSYEGYPMGTALARPLIAEEIVKITKKEGAKTVAHGCTGKGNDQLRFDFVFRKAGLEIIAPMREMNLTREWEMDYAEKHGVAVGVAKEKPYSVDENCWSRSIEGGVLEDPSVHPSNDIYGWTVSAKEAPDTPEEIQIGFEKGVPVSINGKTMKGLDLIVLLNQIAGRNGVGRNDMIEDRILGLKAREIYEHPAATVLLKAHADLERLILSRQELGFKAIVDDKWSELGYMGLIDEPLFAAVTAFINKTQERVTGTVDLVLYKGCVTVAGRSSPNALYSDDLVSFESKTIDQNDAVGFSAYYGFQARMKELIANKK